MVGHGHRGPPTRWWEAGMRDRPLGGERGPRSMVATSLSSLTQFWPQRTLVLCQHASLSLVHAVLIAWNALPGLGGHSGLPIRHQLSPPLSRLTCGPLPRVPTAPCTCLLALIACHYCCSSSCLPHQTVFPSRQGPNLNHFCTACPELLLGPPSQALP